MNSTMDPLKTNDMLKSATIYRNSEFSYVYVCYHCDCSFTNISETLNHIENHFDVDNSGFSSNVTKLIHETQCFEWDEKCESNMLIENIRPGKLIEDNRLAAFKCKKLRQKPSNMSYTEGDDVSTEFSDCSLCNAKFSDVPLLLVHTIKDHTDMTNLTCPKCSEHCDNEATFSTHLQQHVETDGADVTTYDELIQKIIKSKVVQSDNLRLRPPRPLTKYQLKFVKTCDICLLNFTKRSHLIAHMRRQHIKNKLFNCQKCNRKIQGKFDFYAHIFGHLTNDDRVNSLDDEIARENLRKFLDDNISCDEATSHQTFGCKICGHLSLTKRKSAELHILQKHIHSMRSNLSRLKRFGCEYCGRKFALFNNLRRHKRTHSMDKPFICIICNKSFAQEQYLKSHERIHSDFKPHQCSACGKTFITQHQLRRHSRIHVNENSTKCPICNKELKVYRLKVHIREVHENENRPFKCSICLQTFKTSQTLKNHSFRHSGEKRFECRFHCKEKFISSAARRAHERSKHEGK